MFSCQYGPNIILLFARPSSTTQREGTGFVWKYPAQQIQLRRLLVSFFLKDPKLLEGLFFCLSFPSFCLLPTPSSPLNGSPRRGREEPPRDSPSPQTLPVYPLSGSDTFPHLLARKKPFLLLGLPSPVPSGSHLAQSFELAVWALSLHSQLPLWGVVENNTLSDVSHEQATNQPLQPLHTILLCTRPPL